MAETSENAIREQAYYLWEQDGRPPGRDMEYWQRATVLAAEKGQVDTIVKSPPKRPAKAAASKLKAAPAKSTKADAKAKPKKK